MTTTVVTMNEPPPTSLRTSRQNRRARAPTADDTLGRFHKLFSLLDGTTAAEDTSSHFNSLLQTAVQAAFAEDAVIVSYSSSSADDAMTHKVDEVLDYAAITARFAMWCQSSVQVTLEQVQPLAPSILEFTLCLRRNNEPGDDSRSSTTSSTALVASDSRIVCTATLRDGKIISCVEKQLPLATESSTKPNNDENDAVSNNNNNDEPDREPSLVNIELPKDDDSNNYGDNDPNESFHSGGSSQSELLCKGTGLQDVEQRGGAIFMNKAQPNDDDDDNNNIKDIISVTVVTQQDGVHNDLELVALKPPSKFGLTKRSRRSKEFTPSGTVACHLLRDAQGHQAIVLCRAATTTEQLGTYFIDGHLPLDPNIDTTPISRHNRVDFYPRYQFDRRTQKVQIWNGSGYETYMDASHDNGKNSKKKQWSPDMVGLSGTKAPPDASSSPTPTTTPECVAHVSKKGGTNRLRAKIKIPAGDDPSLMICLTAISEHHLRGSKFTKLCLTKESSVEDEGEESAAEAMASSTSIEPLQTGDDEEEATTKAEPLELAEDKAPQSPKKETSKTKKKKNKGETKPSSKQKAQKSI